MPHREDWDDLARHALEPNVFYEHWMMLPAVHGFGSGSHLQFIFVFEKNNFGKRVLHGFFPLERYHGYKGLPINYVRLWKHKYCFMGGPLLRSSHADACLAFFLDWLAHDPRGAAFMEWPWSPGDGPCNNRSSAIMPNMATFITSRSNSRVVSFGLGPTRKPTCTGSGCQGTQGQPVLTGGSATFATHSLTLGLHTITGLYGGGRPYTTAASEGFPSEGS